MTVAIGFDVSELEAARGFIGMVYSDQLPYAAARAVNWTALDAQAKMRERQRSIFDVTTDWTDKAVRLHPFAKKKDWFSAKGVGARLMVAPPGGARRRDVIGKFENDDTKTPHRSSFLWVPIEAPRKNPRYRPKKLGLRKKRQSKKTRHAIRRMSATILQNDARGIFAVIQPEGSGRPSFIFERMGGGPDDNRILYMSMPRVSLPPDLKFRTTIAAEAIRVFDYHFGRSFADAISTAKAASFGRGPGAVALAGFGSVTGGGLFAVPSIGGIEQLRRPIQGGQGGTSATIIRSGPGARDRAWNPL